MSVSAIRKPVRRRTESRFRHHGPESRQIVVSIEPGDLLGFRLLRGRKTYYLPVADAMALAIRVEVAAARAQKKQRRKS